MASRERVEFDVVGRDSSGSRTFKQVGDAAEKAADQVDDLGKASARAGDETEKLGDKVKASGDKTDDTAVQYRGLAHEIEQVEGNVRRLAAEIDRTGNKELFKDLRKQQSELRKLGRTRDLLPDFNKTFAKAGEEAAFALGDVFGKNLPKALARVPAGPLAVVGGLMAAFLVPTLSAAVAGAVVGGVGIGGVVGGVALAAKDARVQAAGKSLGAAVMGDLEESAGRFVEPTIHGIGIIRSAWNDVAGDVDGVFAATSRYVEPLARGIGDAVRELAPGVREAAEAAGPIIREISEGLPRIAGTLSDVLSDFADDADEGASALRFMFIVVDEGIKFVGGAIHAFAGLYRTVVDVADAAYTMADALWGWIPGIGGRIDVGKAKVAELKGALYEGGDAGADAGTKIEGGLRKVDTAAGNSVTALRDWRAALDEMTGTNFSARQAQRDLEAAIDDATAAVAENGKTAINHGAALDINSAKGRANAAALDKIAQESNDAYDAIITQTGSQELANAASDRGRAKFLALADKMGLSKGAATALADELFKIKDRNVTVTANTQPALDSARGIVARINNMNARINVSAEVHGSYGGSAHTGQGYSTGYSEGGRVLGPGSDTSDSVVRRVSRDEFVVRARAARHVGYDFLNMINQADRRPGALAPATAAVTGSTSQTRGGGADEDALYRAMVRAIRATAAVVRDPGRTADIYARGG